MDINQSFEEYLRIKKIDSARFKLQEPSLFEEWEQLFSEVHPDSFTAQKKFLINPVRRRFPLQEQDN